MRAALKLFGLWVAGTLLSALLGAHGAPPVVRPCSTDLDCCERNPRLCAEVTPELYRATWGQP